MKRRKKGTGKEMGSEGRKETGIWKKGRGKEVKNKDKTKEDSEK